MARLLLGTTVLLAMTIAACGSAPLGRDRGGTGGRDEGGTGGAVGSGGATGAGGVGGAGGGSSACQDVLALNRSCATASDCIGVAHTTSCCGQEQFIGLRSSEQARFQVLEAACDATYPACGCAAGQPTADDGSRLRLDEMPGVTCRSGICTTFVSDCAGPCAAGTTCFSCANRASQFAACTTACTSSADCRDPALPLCQSGRTGNTSGMFCTAANVACDTQG